MEKRSNSYMLFLLPLSFVFLYCSFYVLSSFVLSIFNSPVSFFIRVCFSLLLVCYCLMFRVQRKSNRAKEKKARRLEERAAMDAVCAKVDAANKVGEAAVIRLEDVLWKVGGWDYNFGTQTHTHYQIEEAD